MLSPAFGWTVAQPRSRKALTFWAPDEVIEFGARRLARWPFNWHRALGERLEPLPHRRAFRRPAGEAAAVVTAKLPPELAARFEWLMPVPDRIQAVIVGNEVLDAMPVQLLHFDGQGWHERGVAWHDGQFAWADLPTTLRPPVDHAMPQAPSPKSIPRAKPHRVVGRPPDRGLVLLIDYGFPGASTTTCRSAIKAPSSATCVTKSTTIRSHGWATKDITAHVNFTGIALAAWTPTSMWWVTHLARPFSLELWPDEAPRGGQHPAKAHAQKLFTEHEMGELFKVIALSKGWPKATVGFASRETALTCCDLAQPGAKRPRQALGTGSRLATPGPAPGCAHQHDGGPAAQSALAAVGLVGLAGLVGLVA